MAKLAKRDPFWCKLGSQSMQEISQKYKSALDAHFDPKLRRGFPRTHKKFINGSIVYKQGKGYILGVGEKHDGSPVGVLIINKLGKKKTFKFKITRPWGEKIRRITIKRDNDGSLYLIVACDVLIEHIERSGEGLIGMDFGMKHFLTLSDGNTIDIPDYHMQALSKTKKADRVYSRRRNAKKYGSSFKRAKKAKFKAHRKVADKRADFHWKLAHELCKKYRFIAIEDLNLDGMKMLWGRKVSSLGFGEFVLKLMVIADKYGTVVKKVDRFYASSKTCSVCGSRYDGVKDLSVREWTCPVCGAVHDRDVNAAKNILREALSKKENGKDVSRGVSGSKTQVGSAESAATHTPKEVESS
jgi:putative transposase